MEFRILMLRVVFVAA